MHSGARRRSSAAAPQGHRLQDSDLLEEHEQQQEIESAEQAVAQLRRLAKTALGGCGTAVALLYLFLAASSSSAHQGRFSPLLSSRLVAAADLVGAAMALLAALGCTLWPRGWSHTLLLASAAHAAAQTLFWSTAIWRLAEAERTPLASLHKLAWLPTVPPLFVALMASGVHVLRGSEADLRRLRAARYEFKRA